MQTESPWYKAGLRFRCTRCGNCCTGAPGFVWLNEKESADIAELRQEPLGEFLAMHTRNVGSRRSLREKNNGDCVFFDRKAGCTIYAARPGQCRTWPFWDSNVKTPEDWAETSEICPGAGKGDLIPVEEITRRLQVIKL